MSQQPTENGSESSGTFLIGFLIGGLLGAAVALIFAPQSGSDTRGQISASRWPARTAQPAAHSNGYFDAAESSANGHLHTPRIILDKGTQSDGDSAD